MKNSYVQIYQGYHIAKDLKEAYKLGFRLGEKGYRLIDEDSTTLVFKDFQGNELEVRFE